MRIPSGVTDQYIYFVAVDATDFTTRETGLSSFTVYRSRNGAAAAAMTTPTINETDTTNMPGVYELLLDEDMSIDAGDDSQEMAFHITHAGMAPVTRTIELYRPKITAGVTLGVESDGDLTKVNTLDGHTAQTGDNFARLGAPAGASVSADIADLDISITSSQTIILADILDKVGAVNEAAAAGDPSSTGSVMQYVKQLVNVLVGSAGVTTFPAAAAPANAVSLAEVIRAVYDAVDTIEATLAALNDLSALEVADEISDALTVDTRSLPGQAAPSATPTIVEMLAWGYKVFRNRKTQTATQWSLLADNETTVDAKATVSDDGTTAIKQEIVSGP